MEFVFVTPRGELFPSHYPQGFRPLRTSSEVEGFLLRVREHGFFVERDQAERQPAWKQIIPYCVVNQGDRTLLLRRRSKGGEARLHDKLSIGVGGHINPIDLGDSAGARSLIDAAARREIQEELDVRGSFELSLVGFINDDSNPVGAVHLGLVFSVTTSGPVHVREQDVLEGRMVPRDELHARLARGEDFESWSSVLLAHLDAIAPVRQPVTT
jgi:predicted NUDIX family phosphoesterase